MQYPVRSKIPLPVRNGGKSGSVRVIYVDFEVYEKIFLLTAYAKNEKDNLSDAECNELKQLIKVLEDQLKENATGGGKNP